MMSLTRVAALRPQVSMIRLNEDEESIWFQSDPADFHQAKRGSEDGKAEWGEEAAGGAESGTELDDVNDNNCLITVQLGKAGYECLQLHQHKRLTRAQSHHCSDEERKRRKILARKVGHIRFIQEGTVTWFGEAVTESFVFVQKSRRSACETEEDVSIRNNNSGTLCCFSKSLQGVFITKTSARINQVFQA